MNRVAAVLRSAAGPRPDGDLLAAFRLHRDEAAFAELVRRHGPLVWAACRRLLPDHADAEDVFQATFLVLVRKAKVLSGPPALAPWLHKVAAWTARNLRRKNARRLARRVPLADVPATPPDPDARLDLDSALLALPAKYRDPLVLCHLQGLTRREAAERLGLPEGTVSSLLSRGLAKLRAKFDGPPVVTVPVLLATSTVRAATATQLAVSATVAHLTEGVLRMFWAKKATAAAACLLVVFGMGLGVGMTARTGTLAVAGDEKAKTKPPTPQPVREVDQVAAMRESLKAQTALVAAAEAQVAAAEVLAAGMKAAFASGAKTPTRAEYLQALITLTRLQEELNTAKEKRLFMATTLRALEADAARFDRSTIDVTIGGKELGYPLHVNEHDKDGKLIGGAKVEPQAMLVRYLARVRLDPNGPQKLRLNSWPDAPHDHIKATLRSCQQAGFKEAVFHGRMPTNDPEIKFTPPANDPGGKRDGWFEADEVPIKFDELLKK